MTTKAQEQANMNTAVQNVDLEILKDTSGESVVDTAKSLDLVQNVQVDLEVLVGNASITVGELMNLKSGKVVEIDRDCSEPLDLILDGKVIAKGYLVAVGENFGIQIAESE